MPHGRANLKIWDQTSSPDEEPGFPWAWKVWHQHTSTAIAAGRGLKTKVLLA